MDEAQARLEYIRRLFGGESSALEALRTKIEKDYAEPIQIYPEEGKLLSLLVRLGRYQNILEIGTFGGYAALWLAENADEKAKITTIEADPARAERARAYIREMPEMAQTKITLLEGKALQVIEGFPKTAIFDFVFIDADKSQYLDYLLAIEPHVPRGGMIVADNTFLFGAVCHDAPVQRVRPSTRGSMRAFNERLADGALYHSVMLPTHEGLIIALKK
jgi:predicted O-methyltransferase YrrM